MATISLDLVPPFLAVAELGSFSKAAAKLGVEKSSISRSVARFEDHVGERLFHRTTRSVSLTGVGRIVRDRLREPHATLEAALHSALEAGDQPRVRIAITAPADLGCLILPEAIRRLAQRHPHVEIDVRISIAYEDLVTSGVDAALRIATKPLADSRLIVRRLVHLDMGIFAAPSYVEAHGTPRTLDEAALHRWLVFRPMPALRLRGPDGLRTFKPPESIVFDDFVFAINATLAGAALCFLPRYATDEAVRTGRLVEVLPRWTWVNRVDVWFVTAAKTRVAGPVDALRECIQEVLAASRRVT